MRVAIDIRRAGDFGLGTYIRNIVNQFARTDRETEYLLIGQPSHIAQFDPLPNNFELLEYASEPGSFHTHMHLPFLLRKRGVQPSACAISKSCAHALPGTSVMAPSSPFSGRVRSSTRPSVRSAT